MRSSKFALRSLLAAVLLAAAASATTAHEGHHHDAMGTVRAVREAQLDLETQAGKTETFQLNDKTSYRRGEAAVKRDDLKVGERAVVVYEMKDAANVAIEVRLSAAKDGALPSTTATASTAGRTGEPRTIDIKVTDQGYEPARIEVAAGERVRLAFHSETDSACQGTVQSKDLEIKSTRLPQGQTTVIEITAKAAGDYSFACAMAMIRGTVVVKGS